MLANLHKLKDAEIANLPLCVDLDNTLVQTDTLAELAFKTLRLKPWLLFYLPVLLVKGRSALKAFLSEVVALDPVLLPYNKDVFFYVKRMAKRGRPVYLVTGANKKVADSVANFLGIFTGVISSTDRINLVGEAKANMLVKTFGEKNFEYIGDARVDLNVWKHAYAGVVVSNSTSLISRAKELTHVEKVFPAKTSRFKAVIKALRVHQWIKNTLIFLPMLTAHQFYNIHTVTSALLAFFSFSFMASAVYVINDLSDLDADRQHQDKKHRPFASGTLPLSSAFILVPLMLIGSIAFAATLSSSFWLILLGYVVITNLYTFSLKKVAMADIIILSGLYSIRMIAGGTVTGVDISPWLTAFTGFLFISLAMIKRCSELLLIKSKGEEKTVGRGYATEDIPVLVSFGSASGYGAVLVLALYVNSDVAKSHYPSVHLLWFLCPLMIYWISRMWLLANRGQVHSDPVKFALKDPLSWVILSVAALIWFAASTPSPF